MKIGHNKDIDSKGGDDNMFPSASDKVSEGIDSRIDSIINESPSETKRIVENLEFMDKVQKNNIPKGKSVVTAFGVEAFDLHDIFKDMIWDRSIFVTDAIVNMCIETSIERMKKYLPKKTKMGFQYWWLILLLAVGAVVVVILLIFLLPQLGKIKLF
jgi:hypothetical protein